MLTYFSRMVNFLADMPDPTLIQTFHVPETKIHLWKSLRVEGGAPLEVDSKAIGFLPVYISKDHLKKEFPDIKDEDIITITHTSR